MTTEPALPAPRCHARQCIASAPFVLVADDCEKGPDGRHTMTEIFGFFCLADPVMDDDDTVTTASLDAPIGSTIAALAHLVAADPRRVHDAGAMLRRNVARCPCPPGGECPALSDLRVLEALEHASVTRTRWRRSGRR